MTSDQHDVDPPAQAEIHLIASERSWIDSEAVRQLESGARLAGMRLAVGLPDLHPGKGSPIGAAFLSRGCFYPYLAGNDIGCGIGLWQTSLNRRRIKRDRWTTRLHGLESPWEGDLRTWLEGHELPASFEDAALGTIGGGNHFAELQQVEAIEDDASFSRLGLDAGRLFLLVHSGSRGRGEAVLRNHLGRCGTKATQENTEPANDYIEQHDQAMLWAVANRNLIAQRFLSAIHAEGVRVLDLCHNSITPRTVDGAAHWLHRKGAAPADQGALVVPGSRGSLSYLVLPTSASSGNLSGASNAWSLAHGAGRKWTRRQSKARLIRQHSPESLTQTPLGNRVICEDRNLLYEEAPQVYKEIEQVIRDLVDAGLIRIVATLRPIITYKVRTRQSDRRR